MADPTSTTTSASAATVDAATVTPARKRPPYPNETPPAPPPHPPAPPPAQGGSTGPTTFPAAVEAYYKAQGRENTGADYRREAQKFELWLKQQGLNLTNMPPDASARYCAETYANHISHNKAASALKAAFLAATAFKIPFAQQIEITRKKPQPKSAAAGAPSMTQPPTQPIPAANQVPANALPPAVGPMVTPQDQQPGAVPTVANQQQPAPAQPSWQTGAVKAAPSKAQGALPSQGQWIRISKIAGMEDAAKGITPGMRMPIKDYQAAMIEQEGSDAAFVMKYLRGPLGAGTYLFERLDTAGRPTGQPWEVLVMPDPTAIPPGAAMAMPGAFVSQPMHGATAQPMFSGATVGQPQFMPTMPQPAAGFGPFEIMQRMAERLENQLKAEKEEYERKRHEVEEMARTKNIDPTMLAIMLNQIPQPKPPDMEAIRRQLREELALAAPPPAPVASIPTTPAGFGFGEPPRSDPAIDRLAGMMEKFIDFQFKMMQMQMGDPNAKKDPFDVALRMAELMKPPPPPPPAPPPPPPPTDTLREKMLDVALAQLTAPKSNGLKDLIETKQALDMLSGGGGAPSALELVTGAIETIAKNGDKLGGLFSGMVRGGMRGIIKPNALPAPVQQPPPQQPVAIIRPPALDAALRALITTPETTEDDKTGTHYDERLGMNLMGVLQTLDAQRDAQGNPVGPWVGVALKIVETFKSANSKAELRRLVYEMFNWCGTPIKNPKDPRAVKFVDALTNMLHANYTSIYENMPKNAGEPPTKVLADAPIAPNPPPNSTAANAPGEETAVVDDDSEAEEVEDGDDAEDEAEIEERGRQPTGT